MMTAHMDVVPVEADRWSKDPFLGEVVTDPITGENVIWGRGAIDDKIGVIGILSALEFLLSNGWTPKRTFYIGFGHDEEVTGFDGAGNIGRLLEERKVELDFLLDEGMPIIEGFFTGIESPVSVIGVSEKGRMNVRLSVEGEGGHSSIPPNEQAVGILASAIEKIYNNPQPNMFGYGPEIDMINYLAPKATWPYKLIFANTWLFSPLISYMMSKKRESNALIRSTTAITTVRAGIKDNIVPMTAWALINHRVHPAQTLESVLEHDKEAVSDDKVKVEMVEGVKPHPVSPYGPDSIPYTIITGAVKRVYPDAISVPGLLVANTDTLYYLKLTRNVYRFLPILLNPETIRTIHSKNERLTMYSFRKAIAFYQHVILISEVINYNERLKSTRDSGEL